VRGVLVQLRLQARGKSARGGLGCARRRMIQLRLQAHGRSGRGMKRAWVVFQLRLQAHGRTTGSRMKRAKRGVIQLRLQARGRSSRGGLAGRSRACKRCSGLALPCAGGEHH